jgi:hypothetical protein
MPGMSETNRLIIFIICLTFVGIMSVSAFHDFPAWNIAFAIMFAVMAYFFRPRRKS